MQLFWPLKIVHSETCNFFIFAFCDYMNEIHVVTKPNVKESSHFLDMPFTSAPGFQFGLFLQRLNSVLPSQIYKEFYLHVCVQGVSWSRRRKEEEERRSGRPGFKCSPAQKQLEFVRPWGISICQLFILFAFNLVADLNGLLCHIDTEYPQQSHEDISRLSVLGLTYVWL